MSVPDKLKNAIKSHMEHYDWSKNGRPEQQMPQGDWHVWLILAGRGFGKTRTGSESVKTLVKMGYRNICLLGENINDTRKTMVEGESGIMSVYSKLNMPAYYPSRRMVVWRNGAKAHLFSGEKPDSLRGPQFDAAWIDELAKFADPDECWRQINMSVRLGSPKIIITTTPRPINIIKNLVNSEKVFLTTGSTLNNAKNLSPKFMESVMDLYSDTKFGQQEIYGKILDSHENALWNKSIIQYSKPPELDMIVVGVDPSVTANGDETGIIVAGCKDKNFYILGDYSDQMPVREWINVVIKVYYKYRASYVIAEVNQGGDLVQEAINQLDQNIVVNKVRASKSKYERAHPVALLYERKRVYHAQPMEKLEQQMIDFCNLNHSPDRVDALVWAIISLQNNIVQVF